MYLQSPQDHSAEQFRHRIVIPIKTSPHRSKILLPFPPRQFVEIESRQPGLQSHQHGKDSRDSSIAFSEWVDQHQFHVYLCESGGKYVN